MSYLVKPASKFFIIFKNNKYFLFLYYSVCCYNRLPIRNFNIYLYKFLDIVYLPFYNNFIFTKIYNYIFAYADFARPCKLCFKRKGGWIQVRRTWPYLLIYKFGYSHPVRWLIPVINIKLYKKYLSYHNLLLIGLPFYQLNYFGSYARGVRLINTYSRRGIKYGRQLLIKRRGKDSQYAKFKSKIF